jgi:hypothetical protein
VILILIGKVVGEVDPSLEAGTVVFNTIIPQSTTQVDIRYYFLSLGAGRAAILL